MAYQSEDYTPNEKSRAILARGWEHVRSVSYPVSARWLFYRLLQDGIYSKKSDYQRFLSLTSRARHNEWEGWRPDTLTDDTRERVVRGGGDRDSQAWATSVVDYGVECKLDKWYTQDVYLEIWFEANAMASQFRYHTRHTTLVPFGGMPSIPYKYEIARSLRWASRNYGKPIKVLYFGDLDPAGEIIPETSVADIRHWARVEFDFIRAGLNPGDEVRYGIPENPDHPGAYQWEALDAKSAGELIERAVAEWVDFKAMRKVEKQEWEAEQALSKYLAAFTL
jgi:hypothetical protein